MEGTGRGDVPRSGSSRYSGGYPLLPYDCLDGDISCHNLGSSCRCQPLEFAQAPELCIHRGEHFIRHHLWSLDFINIRTIRNSRGSTDSARGGTAQHSLEGRLCLCGYNPWLDIPIHQGLHTNVSAFPSCTSDA